MNLLLTGAFNYKPGQIEVLRKLGLNIYYLQYENEQLPIPANDIDAIICNGLFLYHELSKFTNLKYIQLTSAGFDRVPLEAITAHGIVIKNARGVYSIPMAEWAVCKVLDVYKGSANMINCQRTHTWAKNRSMKEITGKRVAILGAGNVGSEVARRFKAFSATVIGYDITIFENSAFDQIRPIQDFITDACNYDIIIVTLPLTPHTRGLIGYEILKNLKTDAVFVNIARGAIVDTDALIDILGYRHDITAILDVFDTEPLLEDSPLWDIPNIIVSPHNSFVSDGNNARMFDAIITNLKLYLENQSI